MDTDEFRFGIWWVPDGEKLRAATGQECAAEIQRLRAEVERLKMDERIDRACRIGDEP